jgi:hypothetical protein
MNDNIVEVEVFNIVQEQNLENYILLLKEKDGQRFFPIWIGQFEAHSIYLVLKNQKFERPLTHDLIQTILNALDVKIPMVVVNEMKDRTYFARIVVETKNGKIFSIDARPSDSVAIALRMNSRIYIAKKLMDESGVMPDDIGI